MLESDSTKLLQKRTLLVGSLTVTVKARRSEKDVMISKNVFVLDYVPGELWEF